MNIKAVAEHEKRVSFFFSYCDYFLHIDGRVIACHHVNPVKHHYNLLQLRVTDGSFHFLR